MRKTLRIVPLIPLLSVFFGAPNAHAGTITSGTIDFTFTSCYQISPGYCNNPSAAIGSFVYDDTSNTFTSFTVDWYSLSYDFTSVANSFADPSASGCASLPTGDAFIEDLVCAPNTAMYSWQGYSNADGGYSFQFYFATGADPFYFATGAVNDEIDRGSYAVDLTSGASPEPSTTVLLPCGGAILLIAARRKRRVNPDNGPLNVKLGRN